MNIVAWNVFNLLISISLYVILPLAAILGFVKARVFFRKPTTKETKLRIFAQHIAQDLYPKPILVAIRYAADSASCEIRQVGNFGKDPFSRLYLAYLEASRSSPFVVREQAEDGSFVVQFVSKINSHPEVDWINLHSRAAVCCDDVYRVGVTITLIER